MQARLLVPAIAWIFIISATTPAWSQITLTWSGGAATDWNTAANWTPHQVPTALDHVIISSGNVAVPITGVFNIMDWKGGNISGAINVTSGNVLNIGGNVFLDAAITNAGTINWTNGNINMANNVSTAGPIVNQAGGTWNISCDNYFSTESGAGYPTYVNAYIVNLGLMRKTAGTGITQIGFNGSSYAIQFRNVGTVEVDAGTINFEGGGWVSGTYTAAASATVQFGHGSYTVTNATLGATGTIEFTGDNLTLVSNNIPNLKLLGGNLILGPGFQGGSITNLAMTGGTLLGSYTLAGILNWTGGFINGALTVSNTGTLNINGSVYWDMALTNFGTVNWMSGDINMAYNNSTAGPIINQPGATWNISGNNYFSTQSSLGYSPTYPNAYFNNYGLVRKTGGGGTTQMLGYNGAYFIPFRNFGAAESDSGTLGISGGGWITGTNTTAGSGIINLTHGTFSADQFLIAGTSNVQFTGDSLVLSNNVIPGLKMLGGTVILGPLFQGGGNITNLTLSSSVLSGTNNVKGVFNCGAGATGSLKVAGGGFLNWTGGSMVGSLFISNNGVMTIGGAVYLDAAVTNYGTINWTNGNVNMADSVSSAGPVVIEPGATWNIQCDGYFATYSASGYPSKPNAYITNAGTVRKTANFGVTEIGFTGGNYAVLFQNSGTVEADAGVIYFEGGYQDNGAGKLAFAPAGLAGTNFGVIKFSTKPAISGPLSLNLLTRNGFQYAAGQRFQVLAFSSATNWFTCVNGLDLGNGLLFQPQLTVTNLSLVGTAYSNSLAVPRMFILPSFRSASVSWPNKFPGWTLQATTNLYSPSWQPISACENNALVPNTNGMPQFFRLAQ